MEVNLACYPLALMVALYLTSLVLNTLKMMIRADLTTVQIMEPGVPGGDWTKETI